MALLTVTDLTFEQEVLTSDSPVLVVFGTARSESCRPILSLVDQLAEYYYELKIVTADPKTSPTTFVKYGVNTIPTCIFFKNGQRNGMLVGTTTLNSLINFVGL